MRQKIFEKKRKNEFWQRFLKAKQSEMCELLVLIPYSFSFVFVILFPKGKILKTLGDRLLSVAAPKL